ncbi:glycosyltransferase family 2 protein [Sphingorhabdus sp.]|uniref:glycosyltransferase family 2 protein n=1 Tax=Sphingorhabdus sp. TaxID=1902408 RepID=UPI0035AF70FE
MTSKADIVIVNWNSGSLLAECLESILRYPERVGKVVIVDNGSTDGSAQVTGPKDMLIIERLEDNVGFARGCNIGAGLTNSPYVLFLNPDTKFLDDRSLPKLLDFLDSDAARNIGIAGIRLVDETGKTQRSCANFTNIWTFIGQPFGLDKLLPSIFTPLFADFDYMESRDVDQAIGAYFVVRNEVFKSLNGFDEQFFVYWEEVDFCLRAIKIGWKTHYFSNSVAYHKGGGTSENVKAKRLFYQLRSRILYSFKHFGIFKALIVLLMSSIFEPASRILWLMLNGSVNDIRNTLSGYKMFWIEVPRILKKIYLNRLEQ